MERGRGRTTSKFHQGNCCSLWICDHTDVYTPASGLAARGSCLFVLYPLVLYILIGKEAKGGELGPELAYSHQESCKNGLFVYPVSGKWQLPWLCAKILMLLMLFDDLMLLGVCVCACAYACVLRVRVCACVCVCMCACVCVRFTCMYVCAPPCVCLLPTASRRGNRGCSQVHLSWVLETNPGPL